MDVIVSEKILQEAISYIRKLPCNCINTVKLFDVPIMKHNKKICPHCKLVRKIEEQIYNSKLSLYKNFQSTKELKLHTGNYPTKYYPTKYD